MYFVVRGPWFLVPGPQHRVAKHCESSRRAFTALRWSRATCNLRSLVDQCYERGRYWVMDYSRDPLPPLAPADAQWLDQLLRGCSLR